MLVAPTYMRQRFTELIQREAEHARAGRPCGIHAKMNQLQDHGIIRELYLASQAGVPIILIVRGLCCLRAGVKGLSETIRLTSIVGRYLEHSRIYRFENAGSPDYLLGSADWMKRNLDRRVETISPVLDPSVKQELDAILDVYAADNASAWDLRPDDAYVRRTPGPDAERLEVQEFLMRKAIDDLGQP
jgi:polyphosphate kinase